MVYINIFIPKLENNNLKKNIKFNIKEYILMIWFLLIIIIIPHFLYREPSQSEILYRAKKYIEKKYGDDFIFVDNTDDWNFLNYEIKFNPKSHPTDPYYTAYTNINWYPFGFLVVSGDSYSNVLERKENNEKIKLISSEVFNRKILVKQLDSTYSHIYIFTDFNNFNLNEEKNKIFNLINVLKEKNIFKKICYLDEKVLALNEIDKINPKTSSDGWSIEDSTESQAKNYRMILEKEFSKININDYPKKINEILLGSNITYQKKPISYTVYPEFIKYVSFIRTIDMFNSAEKENLKKEGEFDRYSYNSIDDVSIYYSKNYCLDYYSTQFVKAAKSNEFENLKKHFEDGACINSFDNENKTALYWAKYNKNTKMVNFLLQKGAIEN
jgi:hypothetical protein